MSIAQKKFVGIALGAAVTLLVAAPALFGFAHNTNAAAVDQYFSGGANTQTGAGTNFANQSGLKAGDLMTTIQSVIKTALGFLGIIAVVIILLGGFKWMTSGGADAKVKDAKNLIYAGVIGLIIVLSAYAIATFVISQIAAVQT